MSTRDMDFPPREEYAPQGYAFSGKIMLSAVISLFTAVILIVCFHICARWFLHHHRPQPSRNRRRRRRHRRTHHRTHFIFTSTTLPNDTGFAASRGLDSNVLKSIPVFTYSSATDHQKNGRNGGADRDGGGGDVPECAVCLSEFEENEMGRLLPKCKHSFHVECIDMWFHSHSTCPLCRTPVITPESSSSESAAVDELTQIVIDSSTEHDGSGSNQQPCTSCGNEGSSSSVSGSGSSSSSSVSPLSIEVRKTEENGKGPGSRMVSLKRILSRERRMSSSSSMSNSLSFSSYVTDNIIDHGKDDDEDNHVQVQVHD